MNRRRLLRLWSDAALVCYIRQQARRHFSSIEDQEDAIDQAWEEIAAMRGRPATPAVRRRAFRAIKNLYDRHRRAHNHDELADANINPENTRADANG